jgi:hypothetical protein
MGQASARDGRAALEPPPAARHGDLSADADTLDATAFRSRYRLP